MSALSFLIVFSLPFLFIGAIYFVSDFFDTIAKQKWWDEAVQHKEQCKKASTPEWPRWDTTFGIIPTQRPRTFIDKLLKRPIKVY